MKNEEIVYKQVQFIRDNDTRTLEERHDALPFVRDEDLPDWKNWWETLMGMNNVSSNR